MDLCKYISCTKKIILSLVIQGTLIKNNYLLNTKKVQYKN